MDFLTSIVSYKKELLASKKRRTSTAVLMRRAARVVRGTHITFRAAITRFETVNIVAELKKASPSKGILCPRYAPARIARAYEDAGACAISVLTEDRFFKGDLAHLEAVRKASTLPLLQKDFFIDEYQLYEAKVHGADAILFIAALLDDARLADLCGIAQELALDYIIEVHNEIELARALRFTHGIIGINNRDLHTFKTDLRTSERLAAWIPRARLVIAESGIRSRRDIERLRAQGIRAFLIGESIIAHAASPHDAARRLESLLGKNTRNHRR